MTLLEAMLHLGDKKIVKVIAEYSGGGDSGQIDSMHYLLKNETPENVPGEVDYSFRNVSKEVHDFIEDAFDTPLMEIEDWYNNEGGYGTITMTVPDGNITISNNIYFTDEKNYQHQTKLEM